MYRLFLIGLFVLSMGVATALPAVAAPFGQPHFGRPGPNNILPGHETSPKVGSQQAASSVKNQYPNNKILSVNLIKGNGPPVYRIKMLSDSGVVKYVFVDGINGAVFE